MTDYVREALFFAERLAPRFEPVDFGKVFDTVKGLVADRATRRGVTVSFSIDRCDKTIADGILVQRIVANLVSNAIDASSAGQRVAVSVDGRRPGWTRIQVSDEGCGIPKDNLDKIFEPYFTTKEFGQDVRGFGLGLTICQKIVDVHGGAISVKSELGHGTVFIVDLPVRPLLPPQTVTVDNAVA